MAKTLKDVTINMYAPSDECTSVVEQVVVPDYPFLKTKSLKIELRDGEVSVYMDNDLLASTYLQWIDSYTVFLNERVEAYAENKCENIYREVEALWEVSDAVMTRLKLYGRVLPIPLRDKYQSKVENTLANIVELGEKVKQYKHSD